MVALFDQPHEGLYLISHSPPSRSYYGDLAIGILSFAALIELCYFFLWLV